ncbi:DUF2157 domain-containing protein [Pedobacter sp. P351]|uniref:DUF2157 domain-containing protein n=1 Tax=Pedobacter superstes TaxID=3133441 RepID=UPI0030A28F8D
MNLSDYDELLAEGLITDSTLNRIKKKYAAGIFSLYWELKTLLYIGVSLLSTGIGILIYKNVDTIGHQVILASIAALCTACFYWCNKHKHPFSNMKVEAADSFADYILLLGVLSFLTFVAYLQVQYEVFGTHYGMATFIPMLVLFFVAYDFDHIGILTMAIANLGIWMGVSVTPKKLLASNTFDSEQAIYTYLTLGLLLLAAAYFTESRNLKKHFFFSYQHYGVHLTFISLLAGYFHYDYGISLLWLGAFALAALFVYKDAFARRSFYFAMLTVVYSYVAVSGFCIRSMLFMKDDSVLFLGFAYFILSGAAFVSVLMSLNKKLKSNDYL